MKMNHLFPKNVQVLGDIKSVKMFDEKERKTLLNVKKSKEEIKLKAKFQEEAVEKGNFFVLFS
jgi:hypothetical protein